MFKFFSKKKENNDLVNTEVENIVKKQVSIEDITDEDMMVAALIASIEYQEETQTDIRLVSIKQIGSVK